MQALWPIAAPILALALNVLVQILTFRAQRGRHFLRSIIVGFAAGVLGLLAVSAVFPPVSSCCHAGSITLLVNLPLYTALSYGFFVFANIGQSSIRLRIYEEIARSPSGLSAVELSHEYNDRSLMEKRLRRLVESGDVRLREGRYFLGRWRFVPIAGTIVTIKRFLIGKTSQFDQDQRSR